MDAIEARNGIIAGIVMMVIAGVLVLYGKLTGIHRKKVASAYPTTKALVTKRSERKTHTERGSTPNSEAITTFRVELEYTVDGKTYKCKKKSRGRMEGLVTVYYHPGNPKKVYTEEQVLGKYFVSWYIMAGIVGGLGLSVVIYVLTEGQGRG